MIVPASHESIPVDEIPVFIATFLHPGVSGDPVWPLEGPADYPKYKEIGTNIGPDGEKVTLLRDLRTEVLVRRYACIAEYRTIVSHAIASGELRAVDPLTCLPINPSKGNAIRYDLPEFDRSPIVSREEFLRWLRAIGLLSPNGAEHTGQPTSVGITAPLWGLVTAAPELLLKQPEIAHKDAEIEREDEARPASEAPVHAAALPGAQTQTAKKHKLRTNSLDAPIVEAIAVAKTLKTATVFVQLRELAINEEKPFTGKVDGGALFYTNDNGVEAKLTKEALRKRLKNHVLPDFNGG